MADGVKEYCAKSPKRDEVTGEWRKHDDRLHVLYSPYIRVIKLRRWAGHVARMGDRRGTCRVLVDRPE